MYPRFFSTNKSLDLSFLPLDKELASIDENRNFSLVGSLCLFRIRNISDSSNCISLYNRSAAWFDAPTTSTTYKINDSWVSGWWPAKSEFEKPAPHQPKWALHCSSK